MAEYDPRSWFWIVSGDEAKAWSSAAAAYVTEWPDDRVSRIANEVELYDVLSKQFPAGVPTRTFTEPECAEALTRIDAASVAAAQGDVTEAAEMIGLNLPAIAR